MICVPTSLSPGSCSGARRAGRRREAARGHPGRRFRLVRRATEDAIQHGPRSAAMFRDTPANGRMLHRTATPLAPCGMRRPNISQQRYGSGNVRRTFGRSGGKPAPISAIDWLAAKRSATLSSPSKRRSPTYCRSSIPAPETRTPVFDAIVDKALRLCEAAFGGLLRFDGECFHRAARYNLPTALAERNRPLRPAPGMALERLVRGEKIVHIPDIMDDAAYELRYASRVAMVELGGARSAVWVPLRRGEALLGVHLSRTASRCGRSPTAKSRSCRTLRRKRSLRWKTHGCWASLRARTKEIAAWNRQLEERVVAQLRELERTRHLKRFLLPQLAELIIARGDEAVLKPHRQDIVAVFCVICAALPALRKLPSPKRFSNC